MGGAEDPSPVLLDYHERGLETDGKVDFHHVWSVASFHFKGSAAATQTARGVLAAPGAAEAGELGGNGDARTRVHIRLRLSSGRTTEPFRNNGKRNWRRLASCDSAGRHFISSHVPRWQLPLR